LGGRFRVIVALIGWLDGQRNRMMEKGLDEPSAIADQIDAPIEEYAGRLYYRGLGTTRGRC